MSDIGYTGYMWDIEIMLWELCSSLLLERKITKKKHIKSFAPN